MHKFIILVMCLSLMVVGNVFAEQKPMSAKMEGAAMSIRNNTDSNIDFFIHAHAWGCGSASPQTEKISFERGVDILEDGTHKPSYFIKLGKFDHYVLRPGEWTIVWSWPGSMRCVSNNETLQWTQQVWRFQSAESRAGFFKYYNRFK